MPAFDRIVGYRDCCPFSRAFLKSQIDHFHRRLLPVVTSIAKVSDTHSVPRAITLDDIEDIIASSQVEHIILLADRDVARQTVQVPVGVRFVERNIDKHAANILESWASKIALEQAHDAKVSLAMNPNVVTGKHIDFLLQQLPILRGIRPAYVSLARLADCTQKWLADRNEDHPFGLPVHAPSAKPAPSQQTSPKEVGSTNASIAASTGGQTSSVPSEQSRHTSSTLPKERMDELARAALRQGLSEVIARNNGDVSAADDNVLDRSTLSMRWLNRSPQLSARLLRGQFLVQSLHSRLLAAFPIISAAPVVSSNEPARNNVYSVPSEAHRQRLLREINFLIARIEELGSRLSRRPKARRRRRMSSPVNPWTSYINRYRSNAAHRVGIAALAPHVAFKMGREIEHNDDWSCIGCHSINENSASSCRCCRATSCDLEPGSLPEASESMSIRIRAAIKAASRQRRSWIFAPVPLLPPVAGTGPTSMLGGVSRRADMTFGMGRIPAPNTEARRVPAPQHSHDSLLPRGHRLSPDLLDAFKAISVGDVGQNGRDSQSRIFEPRSLDAVRGPLGNLSDFPLPNGHDMSSVNPIPIARSPNQFDSSPPTMSPQGLEYRSLPRRMPGEDQRSVSLDANLLGSALGRLSANQWYCEKQANREIPARGRATPHHGGASDFMLSSSPPLFGGLNGFFGGNGYMSESIHSGKSSGRGVADIPLGLNGRTMMGQQHRGYEPFSSAPQVAPANGVHPIHIAQTASHMEELAVGSIEAPDLAVRYLNAGGRRAFPNSAMHSGLEPRSSLEELAAASDAANGGLGSATMESMRTVLALRTESESKGDVQRGNHGGRYGLF